MQKTTYCAGILTIPYGPILLILLKLTTLGSGRAEANSFLVYVRNLTQQI